MGWQAPNYIYPVPEQPDVAGSLVKGGVAGATMGMKISDRIQEKTLQNDIAAAWKSGEAKVADIDAKHAEDIAAAPHEQSFVKQPDQAEGIKAAMGGNPKLVANTELAPRPLSIDPGKNQITGNKALMMAGVTPMETPGVLSPSEKATETQIMADVATKNPAELDKITQEYKTKRIEAKAGTWNDLHGVYMKHGKTKEAMEIESKHTENALRLAVYDPAAATRIYNAGPEAKRTGVTVDLKPRPQWDHISIPGRDGNPNSLFILEKKSGKIVPVDLNSLQSGGGLSQRVPEGMAIVTRDKDGNVVELYKNEKEPKEPKEPTTEFQSYRKGKLEKGWTEDKIAEQWSAAKSEKEDSTPKLKAREDALKNRFLREYGGAAEGDIESGKLNFEKMMAEKGQTTVKNKDESPKLDSKGNKITLNTFYDTIAQYHMSQPGDISDAERTNNTLRFGQDFGSTKKKAVDLKLPPAQSDAITQSISKHKADGFAIQMNPNTGVIRAVKGSDAKILWDGKATAPGRTASAKPSGTPAPSVVRTAEASETKTEPAQQSTKKGNVKITISMTGGNNLVFSTNAPAAEAIKRKMNALDTLVRQGGLTPKQRDAELRSYAQSYM